MTKYNLTITKDQANLLVQALDMFSRVGIGQLDAVANHPEIEARVSRGEADCESYFDAGKLFDEAKLKLFGLTPGASFGIHNDSVDDSARVAWDLMQVVRHRLSWDRVGSPEKRDFSTMMGVNFDTPRQSSNTTPLAHIESVE